MSANRTFVDKNNLRRKVKNSLQLVLGRTLCLFTGMEIEIKITIMSFDKVTVWTRVTQVTLE